MSRHIISVEDFRALQEISIEPVRLHNGIPEKGSPPLDVLTRLRDRGLIQRIPEGNGTERLAISPAGITMVQGTPFRR